MYLRALDNPHGVLFVYPTHFVQEEHGRSGWRRFVSRASEFPVSVAYPYSRGGSLWTKIERDDAGTVSLNIGNVFWVTRKDFFTLAANEGVDRHLDDEVNLVKLWKKTFEWRKRPESGFDVRDYQIHANARDYLQVGDRLAVPWISWTTRDRNFGGELVFFRSRQGGVMWSLGLSRSPWDAAESRDLFREYLRSFRWVPPEEASANERMLGTLTTRLA